MIEINLLPEELRVKTKEKPPEEVTVTKVTIPGFNQDKVFIFAIPALLLVFIMMHVYFMAIGMSNNRKLAVLNKKWKTLEPQKKTLDEFNLRFSSATQDVSFIKLLTGQRVLWAQKLNKLSLDLPGGVWFNDFSLIKQGVIIQGSVVSLQKEELALINKFFINLKEDNEFFKDFANFELSSVQKKTVGSYDVADFVITGVLKIK